MSQTFESPNEMTAARLVPYSQRWHHAKIVLRVLIICLCALSLGLSFLSSPYSIGMGPVMIADVAWIVTEFITLAVRRAKKRGIHPIAHLILDTLFTLAYFYVAITYGHSMAHSRVRPRNWMAEVWVIIFVVVLLIVHFVLFVRSCIEVHQRRLTKRTPGPMYYISGQGAPFVAVRQPQGARMDAMPAAARSSASLTEEEQPKPPGYQGQLGADRV